jgi:hypothetical protein
MVIWVQRVSALAASPEKEEQLLEREDVWDRGEAGLELSEGAGPAVLVTDADEAVEATDSLDAVEGSTGFSGNVEGGNAEVGGLIKVGESFARKSRYAAGGVTGVFRLSSFSSRLM